MKRSHAAEDRSVERGVMSSGLRSEIKSSGAATRIGDARQSPGKGSWILLETGEVERFYWAVIARPRTSYKMRTDAVRLMPEGR